MNSTNRNEIKQLAQQLENLSKEIQTKVETGEDLLPTANELARNTLTFIFTLGSSCTNTGANTTKKVRASGGQQNYYNVRDATGKFALKV